MGVRSAQFLMTLQLTLLNTGCARDLTGIREARTPGSEQNNGARRAERNTHLKRSGGLQAPRNSRKGSAIASGAVSNRVAPN